MFIVEVSGVMQKPSTDGSDGDYNVTETGGTYTLTMLGAGTTIDNGVDIVIRNFGTTRSTLIAPFKAGSTGGTTLELEKITDQTGEFIKADDASGTNYFRVQVDGTVLVGNGEAATNGTATLGATSLEIANNDLTSHTAYGATLNIVDSNEGSLALQGNSDTVVGDIAIRIDKGDVSGSVDSVFTVTYGGALTLAGAVTATGLVTATGGLSTTAASNLGNVTLVDASTFAIGSGKMAITNDTITNVKHLEVDPWASADETGLRSLTTTHAGAVVINSNGPFMGYGGDGDGVTYGGHGSTLFTDGASYKRGPWIGAGEQFITIDGWQVPAAQGGEAGVSNSTTPARIRYGSNADFCDVTYSTLADGDVPSKKQVDAGIQTATDAVALENKYELLGSHTHSNSTFTLTNSESSNWCALYSKIIIQMDGLKETSNNYGPAVRLFENNGGSYRDFHNAADDASNWADGTSAGASFGSATGEGEWIASTAAYSNSTSGSFIKVHSYGSHEGYNISVAVELELPHPNSGSPYIAARIVKAWNRNTAGTNRLLADYIGRIELVDASRPFARIKVSSMKQNSDDADAEAGQTTIYGIKR